MFPSISLSSFVIITRLFFTLVALFITPFLARRSSPITEVSEISKSWHVKIRRWIKIIRGKSRVVLAQACLAIDCKCTIFSPKQSCRRSEVHKIVCRIYVNSRERKGESRKSVSSDRRISNKRLFNNSEGRITLSVYISARLQSVNCVRINICLREKSNVLPIPGNVSQSLCHLIGEFTLDLVVFWVWLPSWL